MEYRLIIVVTEWTRYTTRFPGAARFISDFIKVIYT